MTRKFTQYVNIVLGLLLILACLLKLYSLFTDEFADIKSGLPKNAVLLVALTELAIGISVVSAPQKKTSWLLLVLFFGLAFFIAAGRWIAGYNSCGCAGSIDISPRSIAIFDLVVFCALLGMRGFGIREILPRKIVKHLRDIRPHKSKELATWGGVILGAAICWLILSFFQGASFIEAEVVEVGQLKYRESKTQEFVVQNNTNETVNIIGIRSSCSCVAVMPNDNLSIPPQETLAVNVSLFGKKPGFFHQRLICFLDSPHQREVAVDLFAYVKE